MWSLVHGLVLADAALDVAKVRLGRIGLRRRHVAHDLAPVQGDPVEGRVGNLLMLFQLSFWVKSASCRPGGTAAAAAPE